LNIAAGGSIVLTAIGFFLLAFLLKKFFASFQRQ